MGKLTAHERFKDTALREWEIREKDNSRILRWQGLNTTRPSLIRAGSLHKFFRISFLPREFRSSFCFTDLYIQIMKTESAELLLFKLLDCCSFR